MDEFDEVLNRCRVLLAFINAPRNALQGMHDFLDSPNRFYVE